jgi:superfamily II DNA or RNA helicase
MVEKVSENTALDSLQQLRGINLDALSPEMRQYVTRKLGAIVNGLSIVQEEPDNAQAHQNDVETVESLRIRQGAFIAKYLSYFDGQTDEEGNGGLTLRKHQHSTFQQIGKLLREPPDTEGSRKICIPYAPSCGKTVIGAMCAKAGGIGTDGLKALVLVPGVTMLEQTAGSGLGKGFELVAPEMKVGTYWADEKDLSGDVTVMTYKSFIGLPDETRDMLNDSITLLVLDEAHRATGDLTSKRVQDFTKGKITLAMAATPEFSEVKGVRSTLGITKEVDKISTRRAIEDGIANGAQVLLLASGQEIKVLSKRGRMSEFDLEPLLTSKPRDELILEIVRHMKEEGRTGIVKCVRGQHSRHARHLAEQAGDMKYWDDTTGELQPIKAAALGNFQTSNQNNSLIEAFENGALDVLFFTEYIKEGFDSNLVEYVLGAEPSTSRVETEQLFGRGMRPKDKLTVYIQLVDKYINSRKPVVTFVDILDEDDYKPGLVIGKPSYTYWQDKQQRNNTPAKIDTTESIDQSAINIEALPDHLRNAAEVMTGTLIDEITVIPEMFQDPPDGWVNWKELSLLQKVSKPMAQFIITNHHNIQMVRARGGMFVPPDTEEKLAGYEIPDDPEQGLVPFQLIRNELSLSSDFLEKLMDTLGLQKIVRRSNSQTRRRAHFLTGLDYERLKAHIKDEYPKINPETDIAITDIAKQLNRDRVTVRVFLARRKKSMYSRYDDRRYEHLCVDPVTAEWAKKEMGIMIPDDCIVVSEQAAKAIKNSPLKKHLQHGMVRGGKQAWWIPREFMSNQ